MATTYTNVIQAVRGVQRKYFHRFADMSEWDGSVNSETRSSNLKGAVKGVHSASMGGAWAAAEYGVRTVVFDYRRVHSESCKQSTY